MNFLQTSRCAALLAALGLFGFGGCASFEREWKSAAPRQSDHEKTQTGDAFTGRWDGRWTSGKHRKSSGDAMGGRLRCILAKLDDRHYEAKFHANWAVFASGYTTVFDVERHGRELRLRGQHRMTPLFGGVYRYEGRISPARFSATYDSSYDHGAFEMSRP